MSSGLKYEAAHTQTLMEQGMYRPGYDKLLYTEEALQAGDAAAAKAVQTGP